MSTRSSLYVGGHLHIYREMHDHCIHLEIDDEPANDYVNIILSPQLAVHLMAQLKDNEVK